jgi:hypothetical protein
MNKHEYIEIILTLKDQVTGEISERDSRYYASFFKDFLHSLPDKNRESRGRLDTALVLKVIDKNSGKILFKWDESWSDAVMQFWENGEDSSRLENELGKLIKLPEDYSEIHDKVMSNLENSINKKVARILKQGKFYSQYSAKNFEGYVWWNKELRCWFCEIWHNHNHIETINAESLEEIMLKVSERYGYD